MPGLKRYRRTSRTSSLGTAILFLFPVLLVIGVFHLYGTGRNIYLSSTDWTLAGAELIGLMNCINLLQSGDFWNSVKVTFFFAVVVPATVIVAYRSPTFSTTASARATSSGSSCSFPS